MGQKVNPHGLRVGVIKDWDSRWFADKKNFVATLFEDYNLRKTLKAQLYNFGIAKIEIDRDGKKVIGAAVNGGKCNHMIARVGDIENGKKVGCLT